MEEGTPQPKSTYYLLYGPPLPPAVPKSTAYSAVSATYQPKSCIESLNTKGGNTSELVNQGIFIYGPLEDCTARLRPVRRPYGSFTACQKAVRFILRTISRTYDQLRALFRRQGISYVFLYFIVLFLRISFIFYGFIFIYFAFYSFTKVNYGGYIQAVLFFSTASI